MKLREQYGVMAVSVADPGTSEALKSREQMRDSDRNHT